MSDEITLVIPRERDFHRVAHLVLGGLAARLDLTYESLEDLQLALDSLLERGEEDGEIVVRIRISDDAIEALVGPFQDDALRSELEHDEPGGVGLRRVLETVADRVELAPEGEGDFVRVVKHLDLAKAS
jgi:anti-sigma regulatory factor (Ser/Thr protein kinase)